MKNNPHIGSTLDTAHLAATGEVRPLPYGRCPSCGGDVDLLKGVGRTREVAFDVVLPIPDDLPLPTCVRCGEMLAIPEVAAVLDALLDAITERDEANEQNAANARDYCGLRARLQAVEAERDALYHALYQLTANAELVLSRYRTGRLVEEPTEEEESEDWFCFDCGAREWSEREDGARRCLDCRCVDASRTVDR